MKLKAKPRKTMRIVYGTGATPLYWTVRVKDAKKDVQINGTLKDALLGAPGQTIGCHLSNCALANAKLFPHPFVLAAFTKATCAIVTKVTNGAPSQAIRYVHGYGQIVDLNDTDKNRTTVLKNPRIAERPFVLRAPKGIRRKGASHRTDTLPGKQTGTKLARVPLGALARARKAGLVTADLANALNKSGG